MSDETLDPAVWGRIFQEENEEDVREPPVVGFRYCSVQVLSPTLPPGWTPSNPPAWVGPGGLLYVQNASGVWEVLGSAVDPPVEPRTEPPARSPLYGLRSIGAGYTWQPGLNTAFCRVLKHTDPPASRCGCGLYGCTDIPSLIGVAGRMHGDVVLCGVRAEGRTIIHEKGWRAARARIVAVCPDLPNKIVRDKTGKVLRVLATHGVEKAVMEQISTTYGARIVRTHEIESVMRGLR